MAALAASARFDPDGLLQCPTPAGWLPVALADLDSLLVDHAACEQKAAAAALAMLGKVPGDRVFVETLSHLAQEEMRHFDLVYRLVLARGGKLRSMLPDPYVRDLVAIARKGREDGITDRLLVAAMIEARSHERFTLLAGGLTDPVVRELYEALIPPEAGHAALFVGLAERFSNKAAVRIRLAQVAAHEAQLVLAQPPEPRIHG
ncbi:MAG: tRNA-(ms[2]io[6]A)-hydroxylase [Candidatus Sericytochromatia bacterium]|nr:tRNA-(ms[2]io[6]A)-hydroxylase [Candidatus Sericytochromatia bacterium]